MIEYYLLILFSIALGIWLEVKKKKINIRNLVIANILFLLITFVQINKANEISLAGYHDFIFYIAYQCSGIVLFFASFQNKKQYILKVYGLLLMILILPTSIIILLDERPQITKVTDTIEIRRINGKIMSCGHHYDVAIRKYYVFEKKLSMDIGGSCQYEKSKTVEFKNNEITLTVVTTQGRILKETRTIQ